MTVNVSHSTVCEIDTHLSDKSRSDTLKKAKFLNLFGNSKHPVSFDSDSALVRREANKT